MKIFLDCGYYSGKALEYYAPLMDESWKVYAFEPNPELNVEETCERFPFEVECIKEAIWTENGKVDFVLTRRNDASHVAELRKSPDKKIKVRSIDFSGFVASLPKEATIICSMDIEGAEFPVLEKMLKDGTAKRLSLLDIEFHHRNIEGYTKEDADELIKQLQQEGVLVKVKVPLEV